MAINVPKLTRRRIFAAAVETTTGTAMTLNASTGAFNAYNHSLKENSPTNERQGQGSLSSLPPVAGAQMGEYDFVTELFGSGSGGTPPAWATVLLGGCSWTGLSGGVFKPSTGIGTTLTMGMFNDGRLRALKGAAGDLTITCEDGKPAQCEWKFSGAWTAPIDSALIAPTYPTVIPPIFTGAIVTIAGTQYRMPSMKIEIGNTVTVRPDVNAATGYFAAVVVNFDKCKVTLPAEALALATKNWSADRIANTPYALSAQIGSVTGNIITITAPAMYQMDAPNDSDKGGILYDELSFKPARNSSAGDDHLQIAFT
jgi:hypothetical protein